MSRGGAAAATQNAHAQRGRFARKERKIFRGRFRIDDAVAFTLGEARVGHGADAKVVDGGKLLQNRQQCLRAQRAIRADHLNILVFQLRRGIRRTDIAVGRAFFGVGELRHNGQAGKRANRINGDEQFFDVRKGFKDVEINAALFEREGLLVENVLNLTGLRMARLHAEAERADGAGDEDFARPRFTRFAGDLDAAAVEALDLIAEPERCEFETVGTEGVGLNNLGAGFNVGLVYAKYGLGLRSIQLIEAALRPDGFVQHRTHRAISDENRVFQPRVEIVDFHCSFKCSGTNSATFFAI